MDFAEVARQLGMSERTVARLRRARSGPPPTRIGKRIYYARDSVLAWLKGLEEPHITPSRRRRSLPG
jgi:predicted DNA-binding transcriptional regulator AlpA